MTDRPTVRGGPPRAETSPTGGVPGVRFTPSLADGSPPGIDVRVERRHGALVVRVAGNLDIYTVPTFWRSLDPGPPGAGAVVVDLADVALIDSAGIGALVRLCHRLREDHRPLAVACGRSAPLFRITGLASALGCAEDLEAALEGLRTVGARR
jgi:anti-sigma B factor antagonist